MKNLFCFIKLLQIYLLLNIKFIYIRTNLFCEYVYSLGQHIPPEYLVSPAEVRPNQGGSMEAPFRIKITETDGRI